MGKVFKKTDVVEKNNRGIIARIEMEILFSAAASPPPKKDCNGKPDQW